MTTVAFVTCRDYANLTNDDVPAVRALERAGVRVAPAIWSDSNIDWSAFDLIVLRSMWDYYFVPDQFSAWLDHMEKLDVAVWNPMPVARWNLDKRYLRDLSEAGIPIVPTVWYERGETPHVPGVMRERGWSEAIAKPIVSATAFRTWRIPDHHAHDQQSAFHELLEERAAMLQEFQPAILEGGEWSVMMIDGVHSHTVVKRAVTGDFRVQEEYGGTTERVDDPPAELLELAERAAQQAPGPWLYARVDAVLADDGFRVMELEMLEPGMFFLNDASAADRFAAAVLARL